MSDLKQYNTIQTHQLYGTSTKVLFSSILIINVSLNQLYTVQYSPYISGSTVYNNTCNACPDGS